MAKLCCLAWCKAVGLSGGKAVGRVGWRSGRPVGSLGQWLTASSAVPAAAAQRPCGLTVVCAHWPLPPSTAASRRRARGARCAHCTLLVLIGFCPVLSEFLKLGVLFTKTFDIDILLEIIL